jgi:hypothetical protein
MPVLPLLAGLGSVGLMYALGARMFAGAWYGLVTAGLFALTPLIWRQMDAAPASLYPLPFVAGWLLAVARFNSRREPWSLIVAGGLLGLGVYSSHAAAAMMPLYMLLTIAVVAPGGSASAGQLAGFVGAFSVAAAPFAIFLARHPEDFRRAVTGYHLYDAYRFNVLQGVHEIVSWVGLTARSEMYYDYFNPSFLFLTGRVLLFPGVVLLPAGLYRILTRESSPLGRLALAGFLTAPFAASLTAERPTPGRILFITVFAPIVSAYGIQQLLSLKKWRADPDRLSMPPTIV